MVNAAILGAGESDRTPSPGRSAIDMGVESALAAIEDAGIRIADIDGVVTGYSLAERHLDFSADLAESLGIRPLWSQTISRSGATGSSIVVDAALAVLGGACTTAQQRIVRCPSNDAMAPISSREDSKPWGAR